MKRRRRIALALAIAALLGAWFVLADHGLLTLDGVRAHRDALRAFADAHPASAVALAFAVYAGTIALSVPASAVLTLTVGFVFGRSLGMAIVVLAATLGSTLAFLGARHLFADEARRRIGPLARRIDEGLAQHPFSWVLFLRLVPVFPFFLVNLGMGLTTIRVRTFVAATMLGILPATFIYLNVGETLATIDSPAGLLAPRTLLALALLALLALAPVAVQRIRRRTPRR